MKKTMRVGMMISVIVFIQGCATFAIRPAGVSTTGQALTRKWTWYDWVLSGIGIAALGVGTYEGIANARPTTFQPMPPATAKVSCSLTNKGC